MSGTIMDIRVNDELETIWNEGLKVRHMLFRIYAEAGVGTRLDNRGGVVVPIPAGARNFHVSKVSKQAFGVHCIARAPTGRLSADVKTEWSYAPIPAYAFMTCVGITLLICYIRIRTEQVCLTVKRK